MDDAAAQRNAAQLDELVEDTSALSATLKRRVKALEAQGGSSRDGQVKKQQVKGALITHAGQFLTERKRLHLSNPSSLKPFKTTNLWSNNIVRNISNGWNDSSRLVSVVSLTPFTKMLTRSIVKPDATPDEVRAVVNDEQGGQIFSQAVSLMLGNTIAVR